MRSIKKAVASFFRSSVGSSYVNGRGSKKLGCELLENRELLSASPYDVPYEPDAASLVGRSISEFTDGASNAIDLTALKAGANVNGQTLTVTSLLDDGSEGTLRVLLDNANDNDKIVFDANLQGDTISLCGLEIAVDKSVTIDATNKPGIKIDAENLSGAFHITASSVEIIGLSIVNCKSDGYGGGISSDHDLILTDVSFYDCSSKGNGGGVYCKGALTLNDAFFDCCSSTSDGGGIYCVGDLTTSGKNSASCISNCSAEENGGGIYCVGKATLKDVSVVSCSVGSFGGGIFCSTSLNMEDVLVEKNKVERNGTVVPDVGNDRDVDVTFGGGGICCSNLDATNCVVSQNSIQCDVNGTDKFKEGARYLAYGGGIYCRSNATLTDVDVTGNAITITSDRYVDVFGVGVCANGAVEITGGTISDNVATAVAAFTGGSYEACVNGGGVYGDKSVKIVGGVVSNNAAKANSASCNAYVFGGGVASKTSVKIESLPILDKNGDIIGKTSSVVSDNSASSTAKYLSQTYGGGVFAPNCDISETVVDGNVAKFSSAKYGSLQTAKDNDYVGAWGGGIYAFDADLKDVDLARNVATNGGGLATTKTANQSEDGRAEKDYPSYAKDPKLNIVNSSMTDNTALENGGAVYVRSGTVMINGTLADASNPNAKSDVVFSGNMASTNGGAVYVQSGTVTISGTPVDASNPNNRSIVFFSDNKAANGGAINVTDGVASLAYCNITDNEAKSNGGGLAVYALNTNAEVRLNACVASENKAGSNGGAVYNGNLFSATNSLFSGNAATNGGAVYTVGNRAESTLKNCTVASNEASQNGGGVFVDTNAETKAYFYNTIIATNVSKARKNPAHDVYQTTTDGLYAFHSLSSYQKWYRGENNVVYDKSKPLFADLSRKDFTLAINSQALDKGNNYSTGGYLDKDLNGERRIRDAVVDIGSYEYRVQSQSVVAAPENVTIKDYDASKRSVVVAWDDKSSDEDGFRIEYYSATTGDFGSATVGKDVTDWRSPTLSGGADYVFTVYAYNANGESDGADGKYSVSNEAYTWIVKSTEDDGGESTLRVILSKAFDGDTVVFDQSLKGSTITLAGMELSINRNVMIDASALLDANYGACGITIDAINSSRVINVEGSATLKGLKLVNGQVRAVGAFSNGFENADVCGGGIYCSAPNLSLENVEVADSVAQFGGGIYGKNVNASNCKIVGNKAVSYFINSDRLNYQVCGGGVAADGMLVLQNSEVSNNTCVATNNGANGVYVSAGGGGAFALQKIVVDGGCVSNNKAESSNTNGKAASLGGGLLVGTYTSWDDPESSSDLHAKAVNGFVSISGKSVVSDNIASSSASYCEVYGGGVYAQTATIKDATLARNSVSGGKSNAFGGGVFALAMLNVDDSTIKENVASGGTSSAFGGGVCIGNNLFSQDDAVGMRLSVTINATLISSNQTSGDGGGVYTASASDAINGVDGRMTDVVVDGNKAQVGGGVYAGASKTQNEKLIVKRAKFSNNAGKIGAAFYNGGTATFGDSDFFNNAGTTDGAFYNGGTATFEDSNFFNNSGEIGGALYNDGKATLVRDQLYSNTATSGGAVYNGGTLNARCCLLDANKAVDGGAFYNGGTSAVSKLTNCTIAANEATQNGGGIFASAGSSNQIQLNNSIVATNVSHAKKPSPDVYQTSGTGTVYAHNCVSSYDAWYRAQGVVLYDVLSELFVDAAQRNYRLTENSQALDKGNNYLVDGATLDLAGNDRVYNKGRVDVGAYERQDKDPIFIGQVKIESDDLEVGSTLTAKVVPNDANVDYQWYQVYSNGVEKLIVDATSATYTTVDADANSIVKVVAKGKDGFEGSASAQINVKGADAISRTVALGNSILPTTFAPTATKAAITVDGVKTTFGVEGVTPEQLGLDVGVYDTLLEYADAFGDVVATYTLVLTVDSAASLNVVEKSFVEGRGASFDFYLTKDAGRAVSVWEIAWGDGSTTRSEDLSTHWSAAHYYAENGSFNVSLTVVYYDGSRETFEAFATRTVGTSSETSSVLDEVFTGIDENAFDAFDLDLDDEFEALDF